jgi:hypothetical protein
LGAQWLTGIVNLLIERPTGSRVQLKMSRARVILVTVLPAMFLLVSVDGFGDGCGGDNFRGFLSPEGGAKQKTPSADTSVQPAMQRWGRRINVQPGIDGFSPPALAQRQSAQPGQPIGCFFLSGASLELAKRWQFLWRTALEPRAPSLVS